MTGIPDRLSATLEGRYRIERELGEGGMATVWLAEDVKHGRKVALKVLKPELAAVVGAERFLAEIETTAGLQHPHILPLFDSGAAEGLLYYVMPYVEEGETLRDRLDREKQLPVEEALRIAGDVAGALDHAHRHGVVHRDVKPANILLSDGRPLVADFGIALAVSAAGGGRLTETGLSLGTPYYMSPEQASADREVGPASDVYALGCVLYEMLVGEPPHTGTTAQAVLARILTGDVRPPAEQRPSIPPHVDAALRKSLERLPADRFASAREFADALRNPAFRHGADPADLRNGRAQPWKRLSGALAVLAAVLVLALGWALSRPPDVARDTLRFSLRLPDSLAFAGVTPLFRLFSRQSGSSDLLVYVDGGLLLQRIGELEGRFVPVGSTLASSFTVSPDGEWLAYQDRGTRRLERMPLEGGAPIPIGGEQSTVFGLDWGRDGEIVYSPELSGGIWRIPAQGGAPVRVTSPDLAAGELGHWYPRFLPGWRKILFTTYRSPVDSSSIDVVDLDTGARTRLVQGGQDGVYVSTGHLLFSYFETLYAVPFDLERLEVTGSRVPVATGVYYRQADAASAFEVSDDGTLVYARAGVPGSEGEEVQLTWVDREGNGTPAVPGWGRYAHPSVSPVGERLAYLLFGDDGKGDIWSYDLDRGTPIRVTRTDRAVGWPQFSADGSSIFYQRENLLFDLYSRDWRAAAPPTPLVLSDEADDNLVTQSPDGSALVYVRQFPGTLTDIWTLPAGGDPTPFRATEAEETDARFSPDGRWLSYTSNESGREEIWIQSFPDGERARYQVSTEGGTGARWGPGGELFFSAGERMMSVRIDPATGEPGVPRELFSGQYRYGAWDYDVSPDGQRFLMMRPRRPDGGGELVVVLDWFAELERLAREGGGR